MFHIIELYVDFLDCLVLLVGENGASGAVAAVAGGAAGILAPRCGSWRKSCSRAQGCAIDGRAAGERNVFRLS